MPASLNRRRCVAALLGAPLAGPRAQAPSAWQVARLPVPEPLAQIRAAASTGWMAVGEGGGLWWLRGGAAAQPLGVGIDPRTPAVAAHGRIVARRADGRLWVGGAADPQASQAAVAAEAGFAVLPLGVIAVAGDASAAHLVRLEPDARGTWRAIATSREPVLPDAQPVQVDLDGDGDAGHLAVLAGPDRSRYGHGVLGDDIEATRVLYLERHDLSVLREYTLSAPHVFEDNRLRPWRDAGRVQLITVRAGPQGAQLALIDADPARAGALRVAALGEPLGRPQRWLSPSSDGQRLLAVHTPHLSGALHVVQRDGARLATTLLAQGVSNHTLGRRELDAGAWLGSRYALPDLSQPTQLRCVDVPGQRELPPLTLSRPLRALSADGQRRALAAVLDDGSMRVLTPT